MTPLVIGIGLAVIACSSQEAKRRAEEQAAADSLKEAADAMSDPGLPPRATREQGVAPKDNEEFAAAERATLKFMTDDVARLGYRPEAVALARARIAALKNAAHTAAERNVATLLDAILTHREEGRRAFTQSDNGKMAASSMMEDMCTRELDDWMRTKDLPGSNAVWMVKTPGPCLKQEQEKQ